MSYEVKQGDCLSILPTLADQSIDAVIADPPYGATRCKWDRVIPLKPLWQELQRVVKPSGAIVLMASQPFTTTLIGSNLDQFRYTLVWDKKLSSGYLNAKVRPLSRHEDIVVFGSGRLTYNPQIRLGKFRVKGMGGNGQTTTCYGSHNRQQTSNDQYYPTSIIEISNANRAEKTHPTQKPVALMEYLVKTYTNQGDTVLDFACGSGTTGVACLNNDRHFIGIEKDEHYCNISKERLAQKSPA